MSHERLLHGLFWILLTLFGFTLAFIFVHFQVLDRLTGRQFFLGLSIWFVVWLGFSLLVLKRRRYRRHTQPDHGSLNVFKSQSDNHCEERQDDPDHPNTNSETDTLSKSHNLENPS